MTLLLDCEYIGEGGQIEKAGLMEYAVPNATPDNVLILAAQMMKAEHIKNNTDEIILIKDGSIYCYDYNNGIFVYTFNGGSL